MDIQLANECVTITLGEDCTIFYVEEHTALIQERLAALQFSRLILNAEKVENFDTAYLQLVLMITEYAKKQKASCVLTHEAACVRAAFNAYGLDLMLSCGDSVCQKVS